MNINDSKKLIILGAVFSGSNELSLGCGASSSKWGSLGDIPAKTYKSKYASYRSVVVLRNPVDRFRTCVANYATTEGVSVKESVKFLVNVLRIADDKNTPVDLHPQARLVATSLDRVTDFLFFTKSHLFCNSTQLGVIPPASKLGNDIVFGEKQKEVVKSYYKEDYDLIAKLGDTNALVW